MIKINSLKGDKAEIENDSLPKFRGYIYFNNFSILEFIPDNFQDKIIDEDLIIINDLIVDCKNTNYVKELTQFLRL